MKRLCDPNWVLIFLFLGIIFAVPLAQTVLEARQDDGVIALEIFSEKPTAQNLRAYEKKLEQASWLGRLSRPWIQFANFKWLKYGGEKVVVGSSGWYFLKPGLNYMLARRDAPPAKSTNDPITAIVHFRDQLAARGIQLIVMPVPNKESIYPEHLTARAGNLTGVIAPRTRELLQKLQAANVEFIDCFGEFHETRRLSGTPLYLEQDTHWSPACVAIAARAAARKLIELGWVRQGEVEYRGRPIAVRRLGDILHLLKTPAIEHAIAPETVSAVQIVRAQDQELYRDDPHAEIVVIGDSFMRIYQEDQPTAAGFIAHLAKELKQPMLSLVNDGGGSTLVREELCARPAFLKNRKVVLWEFVERDIGLGIKGWLPTPLATEPN